MKKKLLLLTFIMFISLAVPKKIFAKTLEINYQSNFISEAYLLPLYTFREYTLSKDFINANNYVVNNISSPKNIFVRESSNGKYRFSILPGVEEDDLIVTITNDLRNTLKSKYGFDVLKGYDTIKFNIKEMEPFNFPSNYIVDFTQMDDLFNLPAFSFMLFESFFGLSQYSNNPPFVLSVDDSISVYLPNMRFLSTNNKLLAKIFYDENDSMFRVFIPENVTYKDNITLYLSDYINNNQNDDTFGIEQITLVFAHEQNSNNESNSKNDTKSVIVKVKNLIKNPETTNYLFISIFVCICFLTGFCIFKSIKESD